MKKIGIVTFYESNNYGAVFQAMATERFLDTYTDFDSEIIRIKRDANAKNAAFSQAKPEKTPFTERIIGKLNSRKLDKLDKQRIKRFDDFRKKYIKCSEKLYMNTDEAAADARNYSAFICGSDQIWNPFHKVFNDAYMLSFVPDDIMKIAYAPSFGVDDISAAPQYDRMISCIRRLDAVSVRERSGANIIEKAGLPRPKVVLDPVFLLTKKEWQSEVDIQKTDEKYILLYALTGVSSSVKEQIKRFAKAKGCEVKIIPGNRENSQNFFSKPFDAGPEEFLSLINGAQYVFTNSFHGAVFSLIFGKKVWAFIGNNENAHKRACRIIELFENMGISDRIITGNENVIDAKDIDHTAVEQKLLHQREASISFLKNSLEKKN